MRLQRLEALGRPALASSTWPVAVSSPWRSALRSRNSSGRCRISRPARRPSAPRARWRSAARRSRGTRRTAPRWCRRRGRVRPDVGHAVGAGGVDRHAVGDGRPPGGIGAGIEVAVELERGQSGRPCAAGAWRAHPRRVALGGRGHALRPREGAATGGRASRPRPPSSGWTEASSLPPKPPPQAVGMMRTCSFSIPRTCAISSRSM